MVSKKLKDQFAEAGLDLSFDEEDEMTINSVVATKQADSDSDADSNQEETTPEHRTNVETINMSKLPSRLIKNPTKTKPSSSICTAVKLDDQKKDESDQAQQADEETFASFGLSPWLVSTLKSMSIKAPTDIQSACIRPILEGKDVIGSAQTGSGKTATFALPIVQKLSVDPYGVFAVVLTPTRELAFQIAEQFRVLGSGINLRLSVVVGGMDMMTQALELQRRPHIIVATPGRLVDHMESSSGAVRLDKVKFLVLDEADRLLQPSFGPHLSTIIDAIPSTRQTLLFSATMTPEIEALSFASKKPFIYRMDDRWSTVEKLDQKYLFVPTIVKEANLAYLLRNAFKGKSIIIFTSRCSTCEYLRVVLRELFIDSTALHSQMSQSGRIASLAKFKSQIVSILITTDVGSRGLDIPQVQVVLNFDLPADAADYVHRVGRTARAGRGGMSVSFVGERDVDIFLGIESKINKKLENLDVSEDEVLKTLNEIAKAKRVASLDMFENKFGERKKNNAEKKRKLEEITKSTEKKRNSFSKHAKVRK